MEDLLTTSKLAEKWGVSPRFVQAEIKKGHLNSIKVGRTLVILQDAKLTAWENNPRRLSISKSRKPLTIGDIPS